jgi:hypothetical protein
MTRSCSILLFVTTCALARALPAQSPGELMTRGVSAYQALDYDLASTLLRRCLVRDSAGGSPLPPAQRARALSYLAATELFRGRRDSAIAAFRALVLLDPSYRPDELVFPPKVTNLYVEVRRDTKVFAIETPPVTRMHGRLEPFSARLVASTLADVTVTLEREDGARIRTLYAGPVVDSLTVLWDGLTSEGAPPPDGRYALRITPRTPDGRGRRALTVPLEIKRLQTDTLPWPEQPQLAPERSARGPALGALGAGLVAGGMTFLLPSVISRGTTASSARFAVGVGLSASGIAGFLMRRRGRPTGTNADANTVKRAAWQDRVNAVRTENAERRAGARLEIRAHPVTTAVLEDSQ